MHSPKLTPLQIKRLSIVLQPGYKGQEFKELMEKEQISYDSAKDYIDGLLDKVAAINMFHAGWKAMDSRTIVFDSSTLDQKLASLTQDQKKLLAQLPPNYDFQTAPQAQTPASVQTSAAVMAILSVLGISNLTQLAPYAYRAHKSSLYTPGPSFFTRAMIA